jgi:hypothetical protein
MTDTQETEVYINANKHVNGGSKVPKDILGSDRSKVVDLMFEAFVEGSKQQLETTPFTKEDIFLYADFYITKMFEEKDKEKIFNQWLETVNKK